MSPLERSLDVLAFAYALLFFPAPIFWLIIHPAIHFWRRFGNRSLWIALPLWLINAAALGVLAPRIYAHATSIGPSVSSGSEACRR